MIKGTCLNSLRAGISEEYYSYINLQACIQIYEGEGAGDRAEVEMPGGRCWLVDMPAENAIRCAMGPVTCDCDDEIKTLKALRASDRHTAKMASDQTRQWRTIAALLAILCVGVALTGCGDGLNEPPTYRENIELTTQAWCEKMSECELTAVSVAECTYTNIGTRCEDNDCTADATDIEIDTVPLCLDAIDAASCSPFITPGVCYTSWGLF